MFELTHIPYVIRVLISLASILLINRFMKQLSISLAVGVIVLALLTEYTISEAGQIAWRRFSSLNSLLLIVIIFQIIWLSRQMSIAGVMNDLVTTVNKIVSRRISMALLPALIGLLPMPGGALFSAPLVDDIDREGQVDPLLKAKINYWFRHIWEYWWPLYPGVLLGVELTGLPLIRFIGILIPLCIISILAGHFFLLRKVKNVTETENSGSRDVFSVIKLLLPIIVIIGVYGCISIFLRRINNCNRYLPMIIGICAAQVALQFQRPLRLKQWKDVCVTGTTANMALVVSLALIYGAFIEARLPGGTLLMAEVRGELATLGIPVVLIIFIIPFICGLTTGLTVGFVGASFPIVYSLMGNGFNATSLLAVTVLAYGSGFMGVILSPIHVCLIVTNEHFKTSLTKSLIRLLRPALVVIAGSFMMYLILSLL